MSLIAFAIAVAAARSGSWQGAKAIAACRNSMPARAARAEATERRRERISEY
jgi:hypothetical protein